jgi:hypothetical protein
MATQDVKIKITALDKTSGALKKIGSGLRTLTKPLLNMKTALVGVLGAGGITLLVRQSLLATDALSKTASKIGTTTEALSALQYAGKITGVEVNTMNMALQRFSRRASEAANGTGEAKGAIRELGINARDLVQLPLDERMLVLADAFQGVKSESDKLRIAFKLFDSEGAALVNTLAQGRGGLAAMLGEAKALGAVMSSEAAAGVEDANDEFLKLSTIFKGILDQTTAALAPALEYIVSSLTETLKSFGNAQTGFTEVGKTIAKNLIAAFSAAATGIFSILNSIIEQYNRINKAVIDVSLALDKRGLKAIERERDELIELQRIRNKFFNDRQELTDKEYKALTKAGEEGLVTEQQFADARLDIERRLAEKIEEIRVATANGEGIPEITMESLFGISEAEFEAFFTKLGKTVDDFTLTLGKPPVAPENNAVNKYVEQLKQLDRQLPESEDLVTSFANNTMNAFTNGFTAAITGAENFADAMKSMAKSVVDDLIRMAVQYYITQQIFGAIVSAFGTPAPKGLNGQPAGPRTGPQVPDFNGGGFTGYGARAGGVDGKGGFPAILHPNESVLDHTRGQGSGVTIVQNINVTTGVQQTVRAEIANLLPQISNAAKSAVADARLRGGGFSKAMVGA